MAAGRSRSVVSSRRDGVEIRRGPRHEEKTSAAYGVGRDSVAGAVAERCPVSAFFATDSFVWGLPDEENVPGTRRWRCWALADLDIGAGCSGSSGETDAVAVPDAVNGP